MRLRRWRNYSGWKRLGYGDNVRQRALGDTPVIRAIWLVRLIRFISSQLDNEAWFEYYRYSEAITYQAKTMLLTDVISLLGKPYFQTTNCLIYNADCLTLLPKLPDACVELTVTSPPYNIGKVYEMPQPLDDYLSWCERWIGEVYRITATQGAFWLNLGYLALPHQAKAMPIAYLLWNRIPFYLIQEIVWNYGAGVAGRRFFSPRNEKFLWYVKNPDDYTFNLDEVRDPNVKYPNQKKNGKIKVNPNGKNPTDVWEFPKVTSGHNRSSKERTPHPAQFPIAVIDRIIRASSNANDVILDPFLGSGTTAVVALELHRPVIGFEIRDDYCDMAASRIDSYLRQRQNNHLQQSLFEEW